MNRQKMKLVVEHSLKLIEGEIIKKQIPEAEVDS